MDHHRRGEFHEREIVETGRPTVFERCHFIDSLVVGAGRLTFRDCTIEYGEDRAFVDARGARVGFDGCLFVAHA